VQRYGTRRANTIHRTLYEEERFTVVATQAKFQVPCRWSKEHRYGRVTGCRLPAIAHRA